MSIYSVNNQQSVAETCPTQTGGGAAVQSASEGSSFEDQLERPEPQKLLSLEARDEWGRLLTTPSADNMEALTRSLAEKMKAAFSRAGLADNPPVSLSLENGRIKVSGRRSDLAEIEEALNSDPDLKADADKLAAVTETMYSFVADGHLAFQREYAMTSGSSATVSKYGHLFSNAPRAPRETVIGYGNGKVDVSCDGREVTPDYFRGNSGWIESGGTSAGGLTGMMESAMIGAIALRNQISH